MKRSWQPCKLEPHLEKRPAADITQALVQQTMIAPGTHAAVVILPLQAFWHSISSLYISKAFEVKQWGLASPFSLALRFINMWRTSAKTRQ